MRQIKFRGKSINSNQWIFGMTISFGTIKRKSSDIFIEISEEKWSGIKTNTLGQYTGINDKNGVEIYEGDILLDYEIELESQQDISGKLPVVYDSSKCQFSVDNSFKKDGSSLVNFVEYFGIENIEVVGNIHDNPEMLFSF